MKEFSLNELAETEINNDIQITEDKLPADFFNLITGDQIDDGNLEDSTQQNTDDLSPENKFIKEIPLSDLDSTKKIVISPETQPDKVFSEFSLEG